MRNFLYDKDEIYNTYFIIFLYKNIFENVLISLTLTFSKILIFLDRYYTLFKSP